MLWEQIKRAMMNNPHRTISEGGSSVTYEEAAIFAERFAKTLAAPCCAVLCQSQLAAALALLSCFAAGVTAIPLSFDPAEMQCEQFFELFKPPFVITDVGGELQAVDIDRGEYRHPQGKPAVILCAAGADGNAAGVPLSGEDLLSAACGTASAAGGDVFIDRPLCRGESLTGEFFGALANGLDIVFRTKSI